MYGRQELTMLNVDPIWLNDVQAVPRAVWYDTETKNNLIQLPVEEINGLRGKQVTHKGIHLGAGEVIEVPGATGSQVRSAVRILFHFQLTLNFQKQSIWIINNFFRKKFICSHTYKLVLCAVGHRSCVRLPKCHQSGARGRYARW